MLSDQYYHHSELIIIVVFVQTCAPPAHLPLSSLCVVGSGYVKEAIYCPRFPIEMEDPLGGADADYLLYKLE